jgi:predicted HTH domain antitoxin
VIDDDDGNHWQKLVAVIAHGKPALVTQEGQPLFMAVPMRGGLVSPAVRVELAVALWEPGAVSLGVAARIAGLPVTEMIDELGRRRIPVVAYEEDELTDELDYVRTLTRCR